MRRAYGPFPVLHCDLKLKVKPFGPFCLQAKSIAELPLVLFGVLTIAGGGLTLLLPETHNRPLPQTVQEITTW